MLRQLREAIPLEACGLMAGQEGLVERLYPIDNVAQSPTAYRMDPRQQVETMLAIEAEGKELLAIYHSHPRGPELPSATDVARASYPGAAYIIVSFREQPPSVRAFTIVDENVEALHLEVVEDEMCDPDDSPVFLKEERD